MHICNVTKKQHEVCIIENVTTPDESGVVSQMTTCHVARFEPLVDQNSDLLLSRSFSVTNMRSFFVKEEKNFLAKKMRIKF